MELSGNTIPAVPAHQISSPGFDKAPFVDHSLLHQLRFSGARDAISVFDISRDGRISFQRSGNDEHYFRSSLPDLPANTTRMIFIDSWTNHRGTTPIKPELPFLPGKLVHDRGEPSQLPRRGTFKALQMIAYDKWNLQNLWSLASSEKVCPLYIQTNILETLLRGSENVEETFDQNRQLLFLGPDTVEFWESLSTVRVSYLSDGQAEGKFCTIQNIINKVKIIIADSCAFLSNTANYFPTLFGAGG